MLPNGIKLCVDVVETFYSLFTNFMDDSDGKGAWKHQVCSKFVGDHPILQLDGVTAYLEQDGRMMNRQGRTFVN